MYAKARQNLLIISDNATTLNLYLFREDNQEWHNEITRGSRRHNPLVCGGWLGAAKPHDLASGKAAHAGALLLGSVVPATRRVTGKG
jgi:hypothetical protein